jgi:SAM-dependent methyltransferase
VNTTFASSARGYGSVSEIRRRPGFEGIASLDPGSVGQRIGRILRHARNVSLFSPELAGHIDDEPSRYHLSDARSNILRPFEQRLPGADVLEIGAGCGAITRYLGESGAQVVALEASPAQASAARARTRDLPNVEIVTGALAEFRPRGKFDFITLIGVLDEASLPPGEEPALALLERAREMLKPEGQIIIAFENGPLAQGRDELLPVMERAGFASPQVLAPYPDYRFPVSIVTEEGFACEDFDSGALVTAGARQRSRLSPDLPFAQEPSAIVQDGPAPEPPGSLLIVAKQSRAESENSGILGYRYTTNRTREYCKGATYVKTAGDAIQVLTSVLETHWETREPGIYRRFYLTDKSEYVRGTPLSEELTSLLRRDGWGIEKVGAFIRRYLDAVASLTKKTGKDLAAYHIASPLPGRYVDLIPRNIIRGIDGRLHAVDQEWDFAGDISLGFLVFRALVQALESRPAFGRTACAAANTGIGFVMAAFRAAGFDITEEILVSYATQENAARAQGARRASGVKGMVPRDLPAASAAVRGACRGMKARYRIAREALASKSAALKTGKKETPQFEGATDGKFVRLLRRFKPGHGPVVRVS